MAVTNHERVGKGLELLRAGLGPFVERELKQAVQAGNLSGHRRKEIADDPMFRRPSSEWDVAVVLRLIWDNWHDAFSGTLGRSDRSLVSELRDHRNTWAHQEPFSSDDAYRALDSVQRLLTSISVTKLAEDRAEQISRPATGASGGNATRDGRNRGDDADSRDLPVVAGTGTVRHARSGVVGDLEPDGIGPACGSRVPPAAGAGRAHDCLRRYTLADGAGPCAALARRSCVRLPARRGLRPLSLPAPAQGTGGAAAHHRGWVSLITWEQETYAFAESCDEDAGRYRALRVQGSDQLA